MSVQLIQQSQGIFQLPKETLGHILFFSNLKEIGKYHCISKVFSAFVEEGCFALCKQLQLGTSQNNQSSFRRITDLTNLIQQWVLNKFILDKNCEYTNNFVDLLQIADFGINPVITRFFPRSTTQGELHVVARAFTAIDEKTFSNFSIQDFLNYYRPSMKTAALRHDSLLRLDEYPSVNFIASAARLMACATQTIFPKSKGKDDFVRLLVNNLDDLPLYLAYDIEKADQLLRDYFYELTEQQIENTLVFFLVHYEVKRFKNLFNQIQISLTNSTRKFPEITEQYPEFKNILDSAKSLDDEELFAKFYLCFFYIIKKCARTNPFYHLMKSDNHSLIEKFLKIYKANAPEEHAFHYANTAAVAKVLFDSIPQYIHARLYINFLTGERISPLLTALLKNKLEVAEFLVSKGAHLGDDDTKSLVRLFFSKSPIKSKWIVFKELICRIARIAVICYCLISVVFSLWLIALNAYTLFFTNGALVGPSLALSHLISIASS